MKEWQVKNTYEYKLRSSWGCFLCKEWLSLHLSKVFFILLLCNPQSHLVTITQCNCFMKLLWVFSFIMTTCALCREKFSTAAVRESLCLWKVHAISLNVSNSFRDGCEGFGNHRCLSFLLLWKLSVLTAITSVSFMWWHSQKKYLLCNIFQVIENKSHWVTYVAKPKEMEPNTSSVVT